MSALNSTLGNSDGSVHASPSMPGEAKYAPICFGEARVGLIAELWIRRHFDERLSVNASSQITTTAGRRPAIPSKPFRSVSNAFSQLVDRVALADRVRSTTT